MIIWETVSEFQDLIPPPFAASFRAACSGGITRRHQLNPFPGHAEKRPISDALARPGKPHVFRHVFCVPDSQTFPRNRSRSPDDGQKTPQKRRQNSNRFLQRSEKPPISAASARPGNSHVSRHAFCVPDSHTFCRNRPRSCADGRNASKATSEFQRFSTQIKSDDPGAERWVSTGRVLVGTDAVAETCSAAPPS